ncbi:hypothetical protein E3N86_13405 [Cryobacterium sp. Hz7]|uniref:hypothetical protein n=1 Tax=Cryobacterium sp. Hz7 TaxID=1259166 RepID=UPI00106B8765|nr:hypothetical protein [Cryobacterium sp. Hz7]TFB58703.1 hypothetical protein E3N86_13405 [Cryobacterium sp. Hz7]
MGIIRAATNWDTFYPDLIVGAVTGIAVGLVLLSAQAFTQWRRSRADSKFAWASLKPTVSGAAHRSWNQDFDSLLPLPLSLTGLSEIASSSPLALWQSHMRKQDPALEYLLVISRLRPQFESCASELESAFSTESLPFMRQTWMDRGGLGRIIRTRAYGGQDSEVYPTLLVASAAQLTEYSAAADHLVSLPRIEAAMARYREVADIFLTALTTLRKNLEADGSVLPAP